MESDKGNTLRVLAQQVVEQELGPLTPLDEYNPWRHEAFEFTNIYSPVYVRQRLIRMRTLNATVPAPVFVSCVLRLCYTRI